MQFTGRIKSISELETGETRNFKPWARRKVTLSEYCSRGYEQSFRIEIYKTEEYTRFLEDFDFKVGDTVKCFIQGKVSEHNNSYFNNLSVFKLEKI